MTIITIIKKLHICWESFFKFICTQHEQSVYAYLISSKSSFCSILFYSYIYTIICYISPAAHRSICSCFCLSYSSACNLSFSSRILFYISIRFLSFSIYSFSNLALSSSSFSFCLCSSSYSSRSAASIIAISSLKFSSYYQLIYWICSCLID